MLGKCAIPLRTGCFIRCNSASPSRTSVSVLAALINTPEEAPIAKPKPKASPTPKIPPKKPITAEFLNQIYRNKLVPRVSSVQRGNTNAFFNQGSIDLEWSVTSVRDIPSEVVKNMEREMYAKQEKQRELVEVKDPNAIERELDAKYNANKHDLTVTATSAIPTKFKTGIELRFLSKLPEILLLGSTNAGKSTLFNNLFSPLERTRSLAEFAYTSSRLNYTKTLNCFNVGNLIRVVDTPGYGVKAALSQGRAVMGYLQEREECKRVYLVISAPDGFKKTDMMVINMLQDLCLPFELVLTKVDKLIAANHNNIEKVTAQLDRMFEEVEFSTWGIQPDVFFVNSLVNKHVEKRGGVQALRCGIMSACGLDGMALKPFKYKRREGV
ncbi:hypothetical protein BABINDRAFT_160653 [Babjeviella inositovora NRRL Y-12698]|uniref:EngB-type G domain-containing protein n=1 Tax=Babjeviella inositovora NRRL Y-12698 TaxID=984486 RepID=A0A1E3QUB9_9ASCO|nr:uncharacterized protein BABINDRAFT_160653 [Babjeviella inositovora NRRL Y-12698]ODQ81285.1 hypothetical protein BABINDRAFT_160653 [Babjeviella inositovora NRRL Y-12698]